MGTKTLYEFFVRIVAIVQNRPYDLEFPLATSCHVIIAFTARSPAQIA